jgi:hypothetical protein
MRRAPDPVSSGKAKTTRPPFFEHHLCVEPVRERFGDSSLEHGHRPVGRELEGMASRPTVDSWVIAVEQREQSLLLTAFPKLSVDRIDLVGGAILPAGVAV